jgi:hypothetical protein
MNIKGREANRYPVKKEEKKKKGEFIEQRKINKRRAKIYDKINLACKEANEKGYSTVEVDNRRFYLASYASVENTFYLSYFGFLRLRKFGLVFCHISVKDRGWQQGILPGIGGLTLSHTTVSKKLAACVLRVVDIKTGKELFFEPHQTYYSQETEDSWWVINRKGR